jgi:hypothetical protein
VERTAKPVKLDETPGPLDTNDVNPNWEVSMSMLADRAE